MSAIPSPSPLVRHWNLNPEIVFLNHGSFGATPRSVLEAQNKYRALMESDPVSFICEKLDPLLDNSRSALGDFVGASSPDLVFVPNATIGVETIFAYLKDQLRPGDEILTNNHEYLACQNNLKRLAEKTRAKIVIAEIPFAVESDRQIEEAILSKVNSNTRIALLSHTTSATATTFPIESLSRQLENAGVTTIVDGAHGIGYTELKLSELKASFYVSNCHKWICAPKGSAFLWVNPKHQKNLRPLVLSNYAETSKKGRSHLHVEFDYVGTADYTSYMCVGDSIKDVAKLCEGGWTAILKRNRELTVKARKLLCDILDVNPIVPEERIYSMAVIPLSSYSKILDKKLAGLSTKYNDPLQDLLLEKYSIQVPIWKWGEDRYIRISCHLYNSIEQYEYLAASLKKEIF